MFWNSPAVDHKLLPSGSVNSLVTLTTLLRSPPAAAVTAHTWKMLWVRLGDPHQCSWSGPASGDGRTEAPLLPHGVVVWLEVLTVYYFSFLSNCSDSARTCQCVVHLRLISFEMEFWLNSSNRCYCKICFSGFLLKAILRGSFTTLPVVQSIHLITTYRLFSIKWRQQISSLNMTSLFCKTRFWKLKAIIFI